MKYYYCIQTHHARTRARACTHACTHTHTAHIRAHPLTAVKFVTVRWVGVHPVSAMMELRPLSPGPLLHSNKHTRWRSDSPEVLDVFRILLGRTETRTCDRMYCQTIGTVSDISQDDRARIATCSLQTPTDRQN